MKKLISTCAAMCGLAVFSGCGNLSNEDIVFLHALPKKDALTARVPDDATGSTSNGLRWRKDGVAVGEPSKAYAETKKSAEDMNAGLFRLLDLLEFVRTQAPSKRSKSSRMWGPWNDEKDRTKEVRVIIERFDGEAPHYEWSVDAKKKADGEDGWVQALTGSYLPADDVRRGVGTMAFHAKTVRDAGLSGADDDGKLVTLDVTYDTASDPLQIGMVVVAAGGRLDYGYEQSSDGSAKMFFKLARNWSEKTAALETLLVTSAWNTRNAGRADYFGYGGDLVASGGTETNPLNVGEACWDEAFNVVYQRNPFEAGQNVGVESDCAVADPDGTAPDK